MKKVIVTPFINAESHARLEAKSYDKNYTDIPNRVLPQDVFKALSAMYFELSGGNALSVEGFTFTARADNGILRGILAPSVYRAATYPEVAEGASASDVEPTIEDSLVIKWGQEVLPLNVSPEGVSFANSTAKKIKYALKTESTGRFEDTCLVVTLTDSATKEIYTVMFPVRSADWDNRLDPDVAEVLLEEGNITGFLDFFQVLPNPNRKGGDGSGRLKGYFIKVAHLPLGEYVVTDYRTKLGGQYGPDYFLQVEVIEPFVAPTGVKDQETGEWADQEVEISDHVVIKPNTALKKILAAQPVITPDAPARLTVLEHSEYNGHPTAKVRLEVSSFEEKEGTIALSF